MRKKSVTGTNRQTVYQRGSQRDGSPHYVFLYSDDESGDEEEILLQPRNKSHSIPRKVEVITVTLKPDDTLQAIALRYRCTISELKRINRIHKENEIFAHRVLKVPVPPFSLLTENLEANDNLISLNDVASSENTSPSIKTEEEVINLISTPVILPSTSTDINSVILNSVCAPSKLNDCENLAEGESDLLLREREGTPTSEAKIVNPFLGSGVDCGMSWIRLLAISLLFFFAGPVIYLFFNVNEGEHHVEGT